MTPWRTATVIELCASMREAQDWSACPILADALQDADYPHDDELAQLRDPGASPVVLQFIVARAYSDESFAATEWLRQFVLDINYNEYDENENPIGKSPTDPHSYADVIEQGMVACGHMQNKYGGPKTMCFGSDAGADYFRAGEHNVHEFFRNWSLATGLSMPSNFDEVHYRCAC